MSDLLFNNKIQLSTTQGLTSVKADIVKTDSSVEIRLIDTSNLFSLYTCSITSSDFYILKRDQDILVDFDRFIPILVNLFHGVQNSKYSATFNDNLLRFIENSEFRNICKLELKFSKPEENQFRKYLGDVISRMENDNVKLIKENSILRDRCINGDRELKDKFRYLESERDDLKRRLDLITKDFSMIQSKASSKEDEFIRISNRMYSLENENAQLKYDLEKYQTNNSISYKDQLNQREDEIETLRREIDNLTDQLKKVRQDNLELKDYKTGNLSQLQIEVDKNEKLQDKLEEALKKFMSSDGKIKKLKDENKEKSIKIEELTNNVKNLTKKLENAQNVYGHFYSRKVDDRVDAFSDTFSLRPESPPPQ